MKITECTYAGPDSDGDINFQATAAIENKTEHTVELIKTSSLLLNPNGTCLAGSNDNEHDVFIDTDDSDTIDCGVGYLKGLDKNEIEKNTISVNAALFRREYSKLGVFDVQDDHKTIVLIDKTVELNSGTIKIYGACLRRDKPDEDGTVQLTACLGVRNVSDKYIERFSVKMILLDQEEAMLEESSEYNPIPPNMGLFIESSIYGVKKGRLRNCKIRLGVSVYSPIGALTAEAVAKKEDS